MNPSLRSLLGGLLAAVLAAAPLAAKDKRDDGGFRSYRAGEPVTVAPDKGYLLARLDAGKFELSILVMRVPSDEEIRAYEAAKQAAYGKEGKNKPPYESYVFAYQGTPNLFSLRPQKPFAVEGTAKVALAELPPGEYVLYGQGFDDFLYQCFCFGTVGFEVEPGKVTDLGTVLFDRASDKSAIPELADVSGLGRIARMDYQLWAAGLRLPPPKPAPVAGLDQTKIVAVRLHAVGPFVETNTLFATRLAPVAGVLAYDGGRVIDVATGQEAMPN